MRVWLDSARDPEGHMPKDLWRAEQGLSGIRLFLWNPPAVSLGWKQPAAPWLGDLSAGVAVVRRPTGGGLAFHGTDVSFAWVRACRPEEPVQDLLQKACAGASAVCESFGVNAEYAVDVPGDRRISVCLAEASSYAVSAQGRKLAGFAVRRISGHWLIQGSLLVNSLPESIRRGIPLDLQHRLDAGAVSVSEAAGRRLEPISVAHRWEAVMNEFIMQQAVQTRGWTGP